MTNEQIRALKLCCHAFYARLHRTGLNTDDAIAYAAASDAVKLATGELYASGEWWIDQWNRAKPF